MIKIDTTSFSRMPIIMGDLNKRGELTVNQAAAKIANRIRTTAIDLIQKGPKSGRTYGDHQASAPGEPPATDSGDLVQSIKIRKDTDEKGTWYVIAGVPYAKLLEFGTERMEARPFMTPAFVEAVPNLKDEIWKAWKEYKNNLSKGDE